MNERTLCLDTDTQDTAGTVTTAARKGTDADVKAGGLAAAVASADPECSAGAADRGDACSARAT